MTKVAWYGRGDGLETLGPFPSENTAWAALRRTDGTRVAGATVWPGLVVDEAEAQARSVTIDYVMPGAPERFFAKALTNVTRADLEREIDTLAAGGAAIIAVRIQAQ